MKRALIALVLLAMLIVLYSCGGETPTGITSDTVASIAINADTQDTKPASAQDTGSAAQADIDKTEFIIYEDRIFFIAKTNTDAQNTFSDAASTFFRSLPADVNKYLLIAPMRIAFEVDEVQPLSADQKAEIKNIYMAMDSSVTLVDAYYTLSEHADPLDNIYFRTDRHWTHLGSYYAAQVFLDAAEIVYHKLDEYEAHDGGLFLGYLHDLANDPYFLDKPDILTYYLLPDVNRSTMVYIKNVETGKLEKVESKLVDTQRYGYAAFLWGNGFSHAVIFGDAQSDRSLLVVGDSHSSALTTWFADSFNTVVVVDPRYFEGGKEALDALMNEYNITDTLLMVSASDSVALTKNFSYYIWQLTQ